MHLIRLDRHDHQIDRFNERARIRTCMHAERCCVVLQLLLISGAGIQRIRRDAAAADQPLCHRLGHVAESDPSDLQLIHLPSLLFIAHTIS